MSAERDLAETLRRRVRTEEQGALFDLDQCTDWRAHWWGMPSFEQGDARPAYRITMNFMSLEDVEEFGRRLGLRAGSQTDSLWFPLENVDRPSDWEYVDES